ncbi:hypothetical protein FH972_027202 [Carpinus fangiana]|uniref:Uncharacterized protein n=1 Tax=Carpinus fangiana TaxID=176857 RepID=A0A5N6L6A4_9ROSI|nr:hypothetical protein FH972_027202 [Carpinus fangiana]
MGYQRRLSTHSFLHFILLSQKNLALTAGRSLANSEVQIFASLAADERQQTGAQVSETRSSNSSGFGCQCGQKYRQEKRLSTSQKVTEAVFRSGDFAKARRRRRMNDGASRLRRHRDLEGEIPNGEVHESLWSHIGQVGKKYFLHIIATNKCLLPSLVVRACNPTWEALEGLAGKLEVVSTRKVPDSGFLWR